MKSGYLFIALATLLFSSMEVALKFVAGQFNPVQMTFSRFLAGGIVLLPLAIRMLKKRGAKRIIANATFPLFTSGLKKFDAAVEEGVLDAVLGTNLTYRQPELLERSWYFDVDCSKYCAYFVAAINHEMSVGSIIDPIKKIEALLESRN